MTERPGDSCETTACSLSPAALRARTALVKGLLAHGLERVVPIAGGVLVEVLGGARIAAELEALIALEAQCCPFLTITLRANADRVKLEVTGPPSAQPLIGDLFGLTHR